MWWHPTIWFLLALVARVVVAARTVVPSHDVHYLWMGEQVAIGDWTAPFSTAHHPLYGILNGLLLATVPELSGMLGGQIVSCFLGGFAVVPLFLVARAWFDLRTAHVVGAFYALGLWYCRHPAACLAEGPLYLFLAGTIWALQRGRLVPAGMIAGLAYLTKPEGAGLLVVLTPWLWWRGQAAGALRFGLGFLVVAAWLPIGFWALGSGFTLSPKLGFVLADGVAREQVNPVLHYLEHLGRTLGVCFEGIGYLVFPLAIYGVLVRGGTRLREVGSVPVLLFLLQLLVIPILRSHHRFVSAYGMLLLPFAAAGLLTLLQRRGWARGPYVVIAVLLVLLPDLVRLPRSVNERRQVVIELGALLRQRLVHGGELATELARLQYFAGRKPGAPRRIRREEILRLCDDPAADIRVCVVVVPRTRIRAEDLGPRGFRPMRLSPELASRLAERHMLVYERAAGREGKKAGR